ESVEHILGNISKRLAEDLREQAKEKKSVPTAEGEAAMMRVVNVIRELESQGEIFLVADDEE
ncbi:MAG: FliG C-terminal domain-containing protein, partial [Pseudomonadota bacterium]